MKLTNRMKGRNILFCLLILNIISCLKPTALDYTLKFARENRTELEKVLTHYSRPGDSLKYQATCFLIENMSYHFTKKEYYQSSRGEIYIPDITCFPSKEEVSVHCDSLLQADYHVVSKNQYDITHIQSDFLIKNIDLAFEVWQKPWSKDIPFDEFCRYILPYRAQIEPLTDLREEFMKRYMPLLDSVGVTTPLEACKVINEQLRKEIRYQATGLPFYPSIEETYRSGISQCDGLCNLGVHIMRAVGIPVAVDFIPAWTKMDLGHSWCAVWDSGKFYSFGPGEQNPEEHLPYFQTTWFRRPAKVYRKRFSCRIEPNSLEDGYVTYLKNPLSGDVTNQYWDNTSTICIQTIQKPKTSKSIIYLCTHNQGQWQPLAIGERNGEICTVRDVWGDNVFIIADSPDGNNLRYITYPFYLDTTGRIRELIPDFSILESFSLPNNERNRRNMSLSYWNGETNRFENLPDYIVEDTSTHYYNIPAKALLRFSGMTTGVNQRRVFLLEKDSIPFY